MKVKDIINDTESPELPLISCIMFTKSGVQGELLVEGKWVPGRFNNNIRIDQPTHGAGQRHGHVLGRNGRELVVVNVDGSASHGKKGRLHKADADALRTHGFCIPSDNIIEWSIINVEAKLILD